MLLAFSLRPGKVFLVSAFRFQILDMFRRSFGNPDQQYCQPDYQSPYHYKQK